MSEIEELAERLEFACIFERRYKGIDSKLSSDLLEYIYDLYSHTYETYTMFELYGLVKKNGVKIDTPEMNWESLMDIIIRQKLDIPTKHISAPIVQPGWHLTRSREDVFSMRLTEPKFEIMQGDVIIMDDGFQYEINEIYMMDPELYASDDNNIIRNDVRICLENLDTGDYSDMAAGDFLYYINCEYSQYVDSNWLDFVNNN